MADNTVIYEVIKTTYAVRFCPRCDGSGREYQYAYHNKRIEERCTSCRGTGKTRIAHETRVSLVEALRELKIINENLEIRNEKDT